ncbi:hypothetical protein RRG08_039480 [Elysia crispata]|uniref:Uncharacterized protein n=1 Tax=Elysia crispata TaxID=231223 RepID=A0AAE0YKU8_9GAST|nr:hypothetical protein RRG08_039480 [Elysia crispata]
MDEMEGMDIDKMGIESLRGYVEGEECDGSGAVEMVRVVAPVRLCFLFLHAPLFLSHPARRTIMSQVSEGIKLHISHCLVVSDVQYSMLSNQPMNPCKPEYCFYIL